MGKIALMANSRWLMVFLLLFLLYAIRYTLYAPSTFAQTSCVNSPRNEGLISGTGYKSGSSTTTFGNTDTTCVLDTQATYRDYKVPTYTELEKEFYTLSRSGAKSTLQLPDGIINTSGD